MLIPGVDLYIRTYYTLRNGNLLTVQWPGQSRDLQLVAESEPRDVLATLTSFWSRYLLKTKPNHLPTHNRCNDVHIKITTVERTSRHPIPTFLTQQFLWSKSFVSTCDQETAIALQYFFRNKQKFQTNGVSLNWLDRLHSSIAGSNNNVFSLTSLKHNIYSKRNLTTIFKKRQVSCMCDVTKGRQEDATTTGFV